VNERDWLAGQVAKHRKLHASYQRFAAELESRLREATRIVAPFGIVQVRAKSISSFAEKAIRKHDELEDPINEFTDLCGARVITRTQAEVAAVSQWVEEAFVIDWANSGDTALRLEPTQFGYRSVHYIVSLPEDEHLPRGLGGLRAEVQVRTLVEHAWADFSHDLSYKGEFKLPPRWQRDIAVIAAQLEDVDRAFTSVEEGLRLYETSYGSYLNEEEIERELAILETVLEHDPGNADVGRRAGKLAASKGDWRRAVQLMSSHVDPKSPRTARQPLLRDLGIALCKLHEGRRESSGFKRGRRYLRLATEAPHRDPDALAALAGTYKGIDEREALELYRSAYEIDPADYYALTNYLECETLATSDARLLRALRPAVMAAADRCRAHVEAGINLPWAYFSLGELLLFQGDAIEALVAYADGMASSTAGWMLEAAGESITRLSSVASELPGYDWVEQALALGLAAASHGDETSRALVVIGSSGSDSQLSAELRSALTEALDTYEGTIVSGGTQGGVPGLVGEIGAARRGIRTVGYVPRRLPAGATLDARYRKLTRTPGSDFGPAEPLAYWSDLIKKGIPPSRVRVLVVGGGSVTRVECHLALALGATLGVVATQGGSSARLLDEDRSPRDVVPLAVDAEALRAFVLAQ
jgi:ppGpp synthetase/RelA/SpoT-type nucleotidyltranferase